MPFSRIWSSMVGMIFPGSPAVTPGQEEGSPPPAQHTTQSPPIYTDVFFQPVLPPPVHQPSGALAHPYARVAHIVRLGPVPPYTSPYNSNATLPTYSETAQTTPTVTAPSHTLPPTRRTIIFQTFNDLGTRMGRLLVVDIPNGVRGYLAGQGHILPTHVIYTPPQQVSGPGRRGRFTLIRSSVRPRWAGSAVVVLLCCFAAVIVVKHNRNVVKTQS